MKSSASLHSFDAQPIIRIVELKQWKVVLPNISFPRTNCQFSGIDQSIFTHEVFHKREHYESLCDFCLACVAKSET